MNQLDISTRDNKERFLPGETLEGKASWQFDRDVDWLEIRLVWFTQGKGDTDISVEEITRVERPGPQDSKSFRFILPAAPYSFSGKLISLIWAVELVADGAKEEARLEFSMAPDGREIMLSSTTNAQPQLGFPRP